MRHFAVNCSSAAKTSSRRRQVENYGISDEDVLDTKAICSRPEATIDLWLGETTPIFQDNWRKALVGVVYLRA
jgi:hypothetical protein